MIPPLSYLRRQMTARPLFCFSVVFLFGLVLSGTGPVSLPFACAAGSVVLCAAILTSRRGHSAAALILVFGFLLGIIRMDLCAKTVPADKTRYSVNMTGRVAGDPYIKQETGRLIFQFRLESVDDVSDHELVRMYLRGESDALASIAYGQTLQVYGHIWAPDPVTNPDEFDFGAYLAEDGMCAYATARIEDVRVLSSSRDLHTLISAVRSRISRRIDLLFPENAAVVKALILADRSHLSDDIRDSFSETGITHLICISGMHVSVLAAAMLAVLRRVATRRTAVSIVLALLLLYGVLIGFTASYARALIMFVVFSLAPIAGYPSDAVTRLGFALLITLIVSPRQIYSEGFVLSYSATAGIILLYPPLVNLIGLEDALHRKPCKNSSARLFRKFVLYFPQLLCATLAAQLATIPAVVAFFGIQPIISVLTNLVCVPLCMLAYPVSLAALVISPLWLSAARAVAAIPEFLFSALSSIALASAGLPVTGIRIGRYPVLLILLHGALIAAASDTSRIRPGIRRFIPLMLIPVAGLSSLLVMLSGLGHSVVFLNAGQADCAVIRTEGHTYLVDAGDTYTPAADYLEGNCLRLDGVFLSHPDEDHSGGLGEVLSVMKPGAIYLPVGWNSISDIAGSVSDALDLAAGMGVEIVYLSAGDSIPLSKNTTARVLAPDADICTSDSNALSMVLEVAHRDTSVLFTGDLPTEVEPARLPDTDILKVAHHGAEESTGVGFLDQAKPEIAVISVGDNSFGHPSDAVIERLNSAGAEILRTDHSGAITAKLGRDGQWHIETYLSPEENHELE